MRISKEQLEAFGLFQYPKQLHLFGDWENIKFNQKTNVSYFILTVLMAENYIEK